MLRTAEIATDQAYWWFSSLATMRVRSAETRGRLSVAEVLTPPGLQIPLHVHHLEDETFVILEGSATFQVGDQTIVARAGDVLFGPRGVPHGYEVGPEGARMLFCFSPGENMQRFIAASGVPARARDLPPADVVAPPPDVLEPILAAHGLEML